jgi:hypothetical protein
MRLATYAGPEPIPLLGALARDDLSARAASIVPGEKPVAFGARKASISDAGVMERTAIPSVLICGNCKAPRPDGLRSIWLFGCSALIV